MRRSCSTRLIVLQKDRAIFGLFTTIFITFLQISCPGSFFSFDKNFSSPMVFNSPPDIFRIAPWIGGGHSLGGFNEVSILPALQPSHRFSFFRGKYCSVHSPTVEVSSGRILSYCRNNGGRVLLHIKSCFPTNQSL